MKTITNNIFKKSLLVATLISALSATNAYADNTTGHIAGQAIALGDSPLSDVEITIVNMNTGLSRTIISDENGKYKFPLLPIGTYIMYGIKDGYMVAEQQGVQVSLGGKTLVDLAMNEEGMETIEIRASSIAPIDTTATNSGIVVTTEDLDRIPVPKSLSSVALLAPGTTKGDSGFGDLVSFGGASVAENAYYINGLNITDVRNGVGMSDLPWEMYDTFEVKTGGFSAEFGRAVGVINVTTKSGGNEFKGGVSVVYQPDDLREQRPDVFRTEEGQEYYGTEYYTINHARTYERTDVNLWASGPIIENTLFFYGIYNPRFETRESASLWNHTEVDSDDALWATKIDWNITDDHKLDITYFSDERAYEVTRRPYDLKNQVKGQYYYDGTADGLDNGRVVHPVQGTYIGATEQEVGGQSYSIKYTGLVTDDLSVSAMLGHNEQSSSSAPITNRDLTRVGDARTGITLWGPLSGGIVKGEDQRDQYRVDFDYYWGDHTLRFGVDVEKLEASQYTAQVGDGSFTFDVETNDLMNYLEGGDLNILNDNLAFFTDYSNNGSFETENYALYLQDEWQVSDNVILNLGVRYDEFENKNAEGDAYVNMDGQWAPRVGVSWDVFGDGESKFTASYGRFYLPIATNTNLRLAGRERLVNYACHTDTINPEDFENLDELLCQGHENDRETEFADGSLKDTRELIDSSIEPMHQDEYMVSYQQTLGEFVWGVRGTYRKLVESIEDVAVDKGFQKYLQSIGYDCPKQVCSGFGYYVLTNPGTDITFSTDPDNYIDNEGNLVEGPADFQEWTIPSEYLGFPEAERNHLQWDLTFSRQYQDDYSFSASYTWAHTWGNSEGLVNSEITQTDSGITQNFDQPGLMDHSSGNLANDRRHTIKVFGSYDITEELSVGINATWQTGRPNNCLGYHPTDEYASAYGAFSFYCVEIDPESEDMDDPDYTSEPSPRGSRGRTPNTFIIDMSLRYQEEFFGFNTVAQLQVFNMFNEIEPTQYNEFGEIFDSFSGNRRTGKPNPDYGLVSSTTTPRYVQLSLAVDF